MKEYAINEALANELLQYLGKQPYIDVIGMISRLSQLKEITIQSDTREPGKPELVPSSKVIARGE